MTASTDTVGGMLVALERRRQIDAEGYTPEHDAQHAWQDLSRAASAYKYGDGNMMPRGWAWKPKNALRDLVRAGALFDAAADRAGGGAPAASMRSERNKCVELIDELLAEARRCLGGYS